MNAPVQATEDLIYGVEDGIARITFNRPQARNALTFAMYEQMAAICETVNADRSIKAMILTGTGEKAFASGTDISQFRAFKTAQDALDYEGRIDRVLRAIEPCRVPRRAWSRRRKRWRSGGSTRWCRMSRRCSDAPTRPQNCSPATRRSHSKSPR